MNAYITRVYRGVEAKIVHGPFNSDSLSAAVIEYLREEPYEDCDSLFLLTLDDDCNPHMQSFGDGFLHQCRIYAEGKV